MIYILGIVLFAFWLVWILSHLVAMYLYKPTVPSFNGFRIVIPPHLSAILNPREMTAVYLHERGHRHHRHIWKNFALVCVFRRASARARILQELEADDYAAQYGYAEELASALRKLSFEPLDNVRARRLEDSSNGRRDAGDPSERDARAVD